ncbi:hypothetical protein [Candidatus Nitrospira neomarina]|uniref:Uncharacterized protein n=1 Tax=Candidatus Nitrospira neomarina TaxID=3020899 RepID=A0AA96GL12_9BACT|nr:hypothetical protein [Candidatus Nitrospira neomarina]WNM62957.1 hypothetical protein PQG83_04185 [Candidatus Nitrospira neomarina]
MWPLIIILFFGGLLSGCLAGPIATRTDIRQSQIVTFEHVDQPQLVESIHQLFMLADPTKVVIQKSDHAVQVERLVHSGFFMISENWDFTLRQRQHAMYLHMSVKADWVGGSVMPRNRFYYDLVAQRLRYLLGEPGAEWETCDEFKHRIRLEPVPREHSFLCVFAEDNPPTRS